MQHGSSLFASRLRRIITVGVTVIGLILFVLGSSQAIDQSDERRYVEGKRRERRVQAVALAASHAKDNHAQSGIISSFAYNTQSKSTVQRPVNPSPEQKPKEESTAKHHRVTPHIEHTTQASQRVKGAKSRIEMLHPRSK